MAEEQTFPVLTDAQIARIAAKGRRRAFRRGAVLVKEGQLHFPLIVVTDGELEVLRSSCAGEELVTTHRPVQFSGELNLLTGRRGLVTLRAATAGEVIELERDELLGLVQTDAELSEIFMRAFILRRVTLLERGFGDVIVLGSTFSPRTLQVREFLARNAHPYTYVDLDRDAVSQEILDRLHFSADDIPLVICRHEAVLRDPSNASIADCLGFNEAVDVDESHVRDVVIVEANAPGGQAGSSMRIENYLGFPSGITGQELATRAFTQAEKFGVQTIIAKGATRLHCDKRPYAVEIENATRVAARTVIIATGAEYRGLPIDNLAAFNGAGVYYLATPMEAQLCKGETVIVVGGGNSAGQAAVYLAGNGSRVVMVIRSGGLAESMSRYLVRRIESNAGIEVRTNCEIVGLEGDKHLERVRCRDRRTGADTVEGIRHLFVMTGAVPTTKWLDACVALDEDGFIKTGADLTREDLDAARWPLARPPHRSEEHPS